MTNEHLDDEAISAHLDGEATPAEASHVDACPVCSARLAELRAAASAIGAPVEVPPAAREAAIAAALDALPAAPSNVVPLRRRGRALPPWLSVAAALLVVVALVPLLGSLGGGSGDRDDMASGAGGGDDAAEESLAFDEETATGLAMGPVEGGDVGEVDSRSVRKLVEEALAIGDTTMRATGPAAEGEGEATEESDGDAAQDPGASSPAPAPCEDVAISEFDDLGALRYRALGTLEGEDVSILAYELVDGGVRALVFAVDGCTIRVSQDFEPS